jgi:hypothetical protein
MKLYRSLILVSLVLVLIFSCSKEVELEITGEYAIFVAFQDQYGIHNKSAEIIADGDSYIIKTDSIGDVTAVEAPLKADEQPFLAQFQHLSFIVNWQLTPVDDGFTGVWRDNVSIEDVKFELRPMTDVERTRIAEEEKRAAEEEASATQLDRSEFLVSATGPLTITVKELVDMIHKSVNTDLDLADFAEDYKLQSASLSVKAESVSEELPYDGLYKIIGYKDFDTNSWNRNTVRLTVYTENKDVAQSYVKGETYEIPFTIFRYDYDATYYVIAIDGTLIIE